METIKDQDRSAWSGPADVHEPGAPTLKTRPVRSTDLLGAARILMIEHRGEVYCLRQTSRGKLILTK